MLDHAADDAAQANGHARVLDTHFIAQHNHGFEELVASVRAFFWSEIEAEAVKAPNDSWSALRSSLKLA